jgi:hypothetical protein
MLEFVFRRLNPAAVRLDFRPTARNQPLQQFLQSIGPLENGAPLLLSREQFYNRLDDLPHEVRIQEDV